MKKNYVFVLLCIYMNIFFTVQVYGQVKIDPNKLWSVRIADSYLLRHTNEAIVDTNAVSKWNYELGTMLEGYHQLWEKTDDKKYYDYIKLNIDRYVREDGKIKTYKLSDFNIDNINAGRQLLLLYKETKENKYKIAADTLRKQIANQPRTKSNGFWHKKIYPYQMWLDGLYMGEPFYAEYSKLFNEPKNYDDIIHQFILIEKQTRDEKTGLLYHAWDESLQQKWADPKSGKSPHFWSRAMGWYAMAIVDVLDFLPQKHPQRIELIKILSRLSEALLKVRDNRTGLWYQVTNFPNKKGNYLEASASAMFIYAFAKGANKSYLPKSFLDHAKKSFEGIIKNLCTIDKDGFIDLLYTCRGAGLGGNPYRDGSYEYYISEPTRVNDLKGLGPLILAAIELEKAGKFSNKEKISDTTAKGKVVGLDYYFNCEMKKDAEGKEYQFHYIWEDKENSGFSQLGSIIENFGATLYKIPQTPTLSELKKISIYIIVDPDTPMETPNPNYISDSSIVEIAKWVKQGGVLILMANDKGNCEFDHLNKLAENFGIYFNELSRNKVTGTNYDIGKFDKFPNHLIFKNLTKIYLKEISTLTLKKPAIPILIDNKDVIMASSKFGKGFVFAVGDPWIYNEYIDHRRLPEDFQNYKAAENLFTWLLGKATIVKSTKSKIQK